MKSKGNLFLGFVFITFVFILVTVLYLLSPVSNEDKDVVFVISDGESLNEIAHSLKKEGLIKS